MKTIIFTLRGLGLAEILFSDLNLSNVILIMNLVFMKRLSDELPHLMYPAIFISHLIVSFFIILSTAPSAVSIMHQVSRTVDSITLSWSQPDQPNGVILDYELQYYEKVISHQIRTHSKLSTCSLKKEMNFKKSFKTFFWDTFVIFLYKLKLRLIKGGIRAQATWSACYFNLIKN